jgi:hypothetical protein
VNVKLWPLHDRTPQVPIGSLLELTGDQPKESRPFLMSCDQMASTAKWSSDISKGIQVRRICGVVSSNKHGDALNHDPYLSWHYFNVRERLVKSIPLEWKHVLGILKHLRDCEIVLSELSKKQEKCTLPYGLNVPLKRPVRDPKRTPDRQK